MATATAPKTKQTARLLKVKTPLGDDVLLINGFSASEGVSRLFDVDVDLMADIKDADKVTAEKLLGQSLTIEVALGDVNKQEKFRYFNGICSRFAELNRDDRYVHYQAEIVPKLWLFTQQSDCRIFQDKNVVQIIEEVLEGLDIDDRTQGTFRPMDYCVQYRETDFNFVSRLTEQEGIFYFFEHSQNGHKLVLANSPQAHADCPHQARVRYSPDAGYGELTDDTVTSWRAEKSLRPGRYTLRDYHFQMPPKTLEVSKPTAKTVGGNDKLEIYDFPGEYAHKFNKPDQRLDEVEEEGRRLVELRIQEETAQHAVMTAASRCRAFVAGFRFRFTDDSRKGTEQYVLTLIQHSAVQTPDYVSNEVTTGIPYSNTFTCIPTAVPYRQPRLTPKPVVEGLQAAVVVGPKGEEIHTDKYGRVRVQFPWDRLGKTDQNSSCWVRVSQQWAGKRWGMFFWPRVGQEVLVGFLEGDPDHPIIVGSVYNAEQMPPYLGDGPDDKHKNDPNVSGIKTNTTKGGEGFNELRFDDTRDKQQIFVHAERNMDVRVKNDSLERIFGNRHQIIGWEKDGKKGGDQRETVYQDKHLNIKRDQVEHIEGNYELLIGKGDAPSGGNLDLVIEKDKKELIEKNSHLHIKGAHSEKVDQSVSLTVGMDRNEKIGVNHNMEAGMAIHVKAGMTLVLEAGVQLSLKVGGNFIDINPAGVFIQGTMVMINSGGAAGAGPGAKPQEPQDANQAKPTEPDLADNAKTGSKSAP